MSSELGRAVEALIERLAGGGRDEAARDALLREVGAWQRERIEPYRRLCAIRGELAAVPTDVFRHVRVAAHPPEEDRRVFYTSGTTSGLRGAHALRDLSLYDFAAHAAARHALFPMALGERMRLAILAPHPDQAPHSSLSYMLARFEAWFGSDTRWLWREGGLDVEALEGALADAQSSGEPLALLGTSFAFVHAEEALAHRRFTLPRGSRLMQTGGFKGRSREIEPDALRRALALRYGVAEPWIVAEYGMTELSSQMYETTLRAAARGEPIPMRRLWVPGWVRATVVDPDTLVPLPDGARGVLRIDDLANLDSVCAIQTSDVAIAHGGEIELLGRAPGATPRGCSLAVEEALAPRGAAHD